MLIMLSTKRYERENLEHFIMLYVILVSDSARFLLHRSMRMVKTFFQNAVTAAQVNGQLSEFSVNLQMTKVDTAPT